jgi:hypothetical protein
MSLQITELRVGNLLKVDKYYWTVEDIINDDSTCELYFKENPEYNHWLNAEPIPFTDEWIVKFGLSKENGYPYKFNKGYLKIRNGIFFFKYHDLEVDLIFVHQFQNLNFALTGVELSVS